MSCKRSITDALYGGTKFSNILDAHVAGSSLIQILSLMAPGIPANGEIASPLAIASSTSLAVAKARS